MCQCLGRPCYYLSGTRRVTNDVVALGANELLGDHKPMKAAVFESSPPADEIELQAYF